MPSPESQQPDIDDETTFWSYCPICKRDFDGIGECPHPDHAQRKREWERKRAADQRRLVAVQGVMEAAKAWRHGMAGDGWTELDWMLAKAVDEWEEARDA